MFAYIWPVALTVLSNVVYHVCAKSTPEKLDPLASLTVTYAVGAVFSAILFFALSRGGSLLAEYKKLGWTPFVLGIAIVGLEVGTICAYKAGWSIGTEAIVQSAFLAIALIVVGYFAYNEALTLKKLAGIAVCLAGLWLVNRG